MNKGGTPSKRAWSWPSIRRTCWLRHARSSSGGSSHHESTYKTRLQFTVTAGPRPAVRLTAADPCLRADRPSIFFFREALRVPFVLIYDDWHSICRYALQPFHSEIPEGCNMRFNTALVRTHTAVLLTFVLASPVAARISDSRSSVDVVQTSTVRIDNFGLVNPNYYRGAQPKGQDYADLAALGVKTLINLTSDDAQTSEKSLRNMPGCAISRFR